MPSIAGITWHRLERESAVTYPCVAEGDPGDPSCSPTISRRRRAAARLVPADIIPAAERPDADYPMVLITGRQLEHWHTGSMTRRAEVLDAIEPEPVASIHPLDLARARRAARATCVTVASRRGTVSLYARADDGTPRGALFIPFCYYEAAANLLTNPALDPFGKIPEFKYCAIRVRPGGTTGERSTFGGGNCWRRHERRLRRAASRATDEADQFRIDRVPSGNSDRAKYPAPSDPPAGTAAATSRQGDK